MSNRPPAQHVVEGRLDDLVDRPLGEQPAGEVDDGVPHLVDLAGVELVGDVADAAREAEDQRRHGEHGEERRLGGQPGDPVAQAGADRGDDQPPQRVESAAPPRLILLRSRRGGALPAWGHGLRHHGLYRRAMGTSDRASVRAAANQVPPLVGHNVVAADLALSEAVVRHGSAEVLEGLLPAGRRGRHRRGPRAGPAGQRAPPRADAVRPLRQPDRRGRVPPGLALADGARGRPRAGRDAVGAAGRRRSRRAPAPRGRLPGLVAHRARPRLPDLDDLRRDPGAARRRRAGQGVDAAAGLHDVRPRAPAGRARSAARCAAWA